MLIPSLKNSQVSLIFLTQLQLLILFRFEIGIVFIYYSKKQKDFYLRELHTKDVKIMWGFASKSIGGRSGQGYRETRLAMSM